MTTPNIGSGVTELVKPRRWRPNLVFRFESTLGAGSSITTPIFDTVPDGFPYSEIELGGGSVIRCASKFFTVYVMITSTLAMKLDIFALQDNGSQLNPSTIFVPSDGNNSYKAIEWTCPGRRCQFRVINQPLGPSPGTNSALTLEVVNEG